MIRLLICLTFLALVGCATDHAKVNGGSVEFQRNAFLYPAKVNGVTFTRTSVLTNGTKVVDQFRLEGLDSDGGAANIRALGTFLGTATGAAVKAAAVPLAPQ